MGNLPYAPFERILRDVEGNLRVSDTATKELTLVAETVAKRIAQEAAEFAQHAGRRTITEADVRLAGKRHA